MAQTGRTGQFKGRKRVRRWLETADKAIRTEGRIWMEVRETSAVGTQDGQ